MQLIRCPELRSLQYTVLPVLDEDGGAALAGFMAGPWILERPTVRPFDRPPGAPSAYLCFLHTDPIVGFSWILIRLPAGSQPRPVSIISGLG